MREVDLSLSEYKDKKLYCGELHMLQRLCTKR